MPIGLFSLAFPSSSHPPRSPLSFLPSACLPFSVRFVQLKVTGQVPGGPCDGPCEARVKVGWDAAWGVRGRMCAGVEKLHHPQWMKGGRFLSDKGGTNTERRTLKNPVVLG